MLDTIKINTTKIQIIKPIQVQDVYGSPSRVETFSYPRMGIKEKRFIKSSQYIEKTGNYYPSVTFRSNRKIYIEFSAPKILFDNNVEELADSDKDDFIRALGERLFDMGLSIPEKDLWESSVSFATVSKNVILQDAGASEFIEFTRRLWWKWRHSLKIESYEENGVSIRKFSSSTGIGIYAKVPSLRSIKTKTHKEFELASGLKENNILRFEYRMQTYQRTKTKYAWAMGRNLKEIKLQDIFHSRLSQKILLYDLSKSLFSDEFKLIPMRLPTIRKMYDFLTNKGLKPSEEWAVIACFRLCSDLGIESAKDIFETRYSKSSTKRVFKLCNQVFSDYKDYEYSKIRDQLKFGLENFKKINIEKIESFLPKMKNELGQPRLFY